MNFSHFNKVVFAASLLATGFSYADSDRPLLSLSVSQSGGTALNSEGSLDTRTPASQSRVLPIWGDEARARGYDLPEPFGVSYNYMNLRQDVIVDKIGFSAEKALGQRILSNIIIDVGHTRSSNESHMLKLDSWVFPFMNVYGLYGKTKGSSTAQLNSVGSKTDSLVSNVPFDLDYEGKTYGAGFTLAGGYNQFFGTFDLNYTKTNLDILDGDLRGGGETGGIENGKLRIENFLLGREEFLQGSQQGYYTQDPAGIDGDTGHGASHGTSIGVTGVGE